MKDRGKDGKEHTSDREHREGYIKAWNDTRDSPHSLTGRSQKGICQAKPIQSAKGLIVQIRLYVR